jgi:cytosine/adenosine deaminase-related metal-dependent hydrolase
MVMAGHLLPDQALHMVSGASRAAISGTADEIRAGQRADLVVIDAASVREALAFQPSGRIVFHAGHRVA